MKEIVVTNQAIPAKGRSKNYRNTVGQVVLNGGGSATQTVIATGGAADEAKHALNADEATHAAKADYATGAGYADKAGYADDAGSADNATVAQNLSDDSTDWSKIDGKDATILSSAIQYVLANALSKINPDTAQKLITFLGGIKLGSNFGIDATGNATLNQIVSSVIQNAGSITTKDLTVTGLAHFFKLIIDEIKSIGGSILVTPTDGFTVDKVEAVTGGYKLYWKATDGSGKARSNLWEVGDQAIHMTFNEAVSGTTYGTNNCFYWAAVTAKNEDDANGNPLPVKVDINGITFDCNYIVISTTNKATNCTVNPQAGHEIAMLGYQGADDIKRQSAIYLSAYASLDTGLTAPFFALYRGLNNFNLETHRSTYIDALNSKFFGSFSINVNGTNQDIKDYVDTTNSTTLNVTNGQIQAAVADMNSKYATVTQDVDGLRTDVGDKVGKTEFQQTSDSFSLNIARNTGNLIWYSGFSPLKNYGERPNSGYNPTNPSYFSIDNTNVKFSGVPSLKISVSGLSQEAWAGTWWASGISVNVSQAYTLSFYLMSDNPSTIDGTAYYEIITYDESGNRLTTDYQYNSNLKPTTANQWFLHIRSFTTPANAAKIDLIIGLSKNGRLWISCPNLVVGANAETGYLIANGEELLPAGINVKKGIIEHISSETLFKDMSGNLTILFDHVTGKIKTNFINAQEIESGVLRTVPGTDGSYIEMYTNKSITYGRGGRIARESYLDEDGMPHDIYYNPDGTPAGDMSYQGWRATISQIRAAYYENLMAASLGGTTMTSVISSTGTTYYKYHASYDQQRHIYGSDEAYNDMVYNSKSTSAATISDGWYLNRSYSDVLWRSANGGSIVNDVWMVQVLHFEGGKSTEVQWGYYTKVGSTYTKTDEYGNPVADTLYPFG